MLSMQMQTPQFTNRRPPAPFQPAHGTKKTPQTLYISPFRRSALFAVFPCNHANSNRNKHHSVNFLSKHLSSHRLMSPLYRRLAGFISANAHGFVGTSHMSAIRSHMKSSFSGTLTESSKPSSDAEPLPPTQASTLSFRLPKIGSRSST